MGAFLEKARPWAAFAAEAMAETLWPTRCALCDRPGQVLCDACAASLPYLDRWRACERCGSPYGLVQCDLCNGVSLARIGRDELPFAGCASATVFGDEAGRIVRTYKDLGERRLSTVMAAAMARAVPPAWRADAVAFVPASPAARRYRGFDHAELLAGEVALLLGLPSAALLARPRTRDQRSLTAQRRIANLSAAFSALPGATAPPRLLLVDDVFTTGATLCAATDALLAAGASEVRCLTFARV